MQWSRLCFSKYCTEQRQLILVGGAGARFHFDDVKQWKHSCFYMGKARILQPPYIP